MVETLIVQVAPHTPQSYGMSWLLTAIIFLFVVISFRFSKNTRYFSALIDDLTDVRVRHNAFDDTVRETSFLLLLNLFWCFGAGILLYYFTASGSAWTEAAEVSDIVKGSLLCIGVAFGYSIIMTLFYYLVGNVFSDSDKTTIWIKGYLSSQGLSALVMVPAAILALVLPGSVGGVLFVGGLGFVAAKIIFIFKGFRIFFNQTASWVLFLYYLCSLEIVPLVLTYWAALKMYSLLV